MPFSNETGLMVKYVMNKYDEDYNQTLGTAELNSILSFANFVGVSFMEKTMKIKNKNILFSIWDLGGTQSHLLWFWIFLSLATSAHAAGKAEFMKMLPLVCDEAEAILFIYDLTRVDTLAAIKQWYVVAWR
jgi:GTP-binding protein of the ras superfamily involved in termination of M-phase